MSDFKINNSIKHYRIKAGLSQIAAASLLNLNRSTYTRYETGDRVPSLEVLQNMATLFNTTLDKLITPSAKSHFPQAYQLKKMPNLPTSQNFYLNYYHFASDFNQLTEQEKSYILNVIKHLINAHK